MEIKREYPSKVVDIHTHIFNARYIPLEGALTSWGVPSVLAKLLKPLLNLLVGGEDEFESVRRRDLSFKNFVRDNDDPNVLGEALALIAAGVLSNNLLEIRGKRLAADELRVAIQNDNLHVALQKIDKAYQDETHKVTILSEELLSNLISILTDKTLTIKSDIKQRLHITIFNWLKDCLIWLLSKLINEVRPVYASGVDIVKFVLLMLLTEDKIKNALLSEYDGEQNANLMVHHMMDMEKAYDEIPKYPFEEQIQRMNDVLQGERKILGFIAFDPRRTGNGNGNESSLTLIKEQIESKKFKGIKLYPPMGYKAIGNAKSEIDDQLNKLTTVRLRFNVLI